MAPEAQEWPGRRCTPILALAAVLAIAATAVAPARAAAQIRGLMCRGGPAAFQTGVTSNPSPRNETDVEMRLGYTRSQTRPGDDWQALKAGNCSWNDTTAVEPGFLHFDTAIDAQEGVEATGGQRDTSLTAAVGSPDMQSIPRYLTDSRHYWIFYVEEGEKQLAISHGPWQPLLGGAGAGGDTATSPPRGTRRFGDGEQPTSRETPTMPGTRRIGAVPLPPSREAPAPLGTSRLGDTLASPPSSTDVASRARIFDVQVLLEAPPRPSGWRRLLPSRFEPSVTFKIRPPPDATPVVQISAYPPVRDPATGRWRLESPTYLAVDRGWAWWGDDVRCTAALGSLPQGTPYHFLIEVARDGPDAPPHQYVGRFTTPGRRVY